MVEDPTKSRRAHWEARCQEIGERTFAASQKGLARAESSFVTDFWQSFDSQMSAWAVELSAQDLDNDARAIWSMYEKKTGLLTWARSPTLGGIFGIKAVQYCIQEMKDAFDNGVAIYTSEGIKLIQAAFDTKMKERFDCIPKT